MKKSGKIKWWLVWHFAAKRFLKKIFKENPKMLESVLSFMKGAKSRLGGFGAFLAAVGGWMAGLGEIDAWSFSVVMEQAQALFLLLASYGLWDKLVRNDGLLSKLIDWIKSRAD